MDRRTFLASGLGGLGVATAGCSSILGSTVTLSDPETGEQDEGTERYLTYRDDGDRIVTLGFDQRDVRDSLKDRFGFRITVSHSDDTKIESVQFDLRAPSTSIDPPAEIYLQAPGGGLWPDLTYKVVEDSWTRIALEDTGELGEGTMNLETIVSPGSLPAEDIGIRADLKLSDTGGAGRTYQIDTRTDFKPVQS
jgi:hypothetical protein